MTKDITLLMLWSFRHWVFFVDELMCAMKLTRNLFDFNFGKGRDRGMIKTKYRDNMRTQDSRKKFIF